MDDRTWWALQISLAVFVTVFVSAVAVMGFDQDPARAILGSMVGSWLGVGLNLYLRKP